VDSIFIKEIQKRGRDDFLAVWEVPAEVSRQLLLEGEFGFRITGQSRRKPLNKNTA